MAPGSRMRPRSRSSSSEGTDHMAEETRQGQTLQQTRRDYRQEVTDRIVRMLEEGTAPWQKPWESGQDIRLPHNPTTAKNYRGGNAIHLLAASLEKGYGDPRWMTYKQAQEQGWQVRQGEKGTQIEFWEVREHALGTEDESRSKDQALDNPGSRERQLIHRIYTVFNARQIDGVPGREPHRVPEWQAVEAGERILQQSGAVIMHDQADRAFYDKRRDAVHLPAKDAFQRAADYYGTALHELAHWSGHPSRLNRPTLNDSVHFGDESYAKEELRAELASVFMAAEQGIPHNPERHASYVASWIKALKGDKNEIFRAASDAHAAADYLLSLDKALERGQPAQPRAESSQVVAQYEPGSKTISVLDKGTATERRAIVPSTQEVAHGSSTRVHSGQQVTTPDAERSLAQAQEVTRKILGGAARRLDAHTNSGTYSGPIIGLTDHHVVQRISGSAAVAHPRELLGAAIPAQGQSVRINYANHTAMLSAIEPKAKVRQLGR